MSKRKEKRVSNPLRTLNTLFSLWGKKCVTQEEVLDRLRELTIYTETQRVTAAKEQEHSHFKEAGEMWASLTALFEKPAKTGIEAEPQGERHMTDDERLCREGGSREGTTQTTEKDPLWLSIELPGGENEYPEPHCQVILYSLGYSIGLETKTPQEALTLFNALQTITQIEAD